MTPKITTTHLAGEYDLAIVVGNRTWRWLQQRHADTRGVFELLRGDPHAPEDPNECEMPYTRWSDAGEMDQRSVLLQLAQPSFEGIESLEFESLTALDNHIAGVLGPLVPVKGVDPFGMAARVQTLVRSLYTSGGRRARERRGAN